MVDGLLMVRESLLKLIFGQTNIKFVPVTGSAFNFGFVDEVRSLTFSIQGALALKSEQVFRVGCQMATSV